MSSIPISSYLSVLPPELLTSILSHLLTKHLVQASTTCRKIHACADYLIHQRIRHINDLDGHHLVFECSPPSGRFTTPYHKCQYTGTYPVTTLRGGADAIPTKINPSAIYSHFTPLPPHTSCSPHPSSTVSSQLISTNLPFESNEYFTQLYASSMLAKRAEKAVSVLTVFSETFFRIRRSWLEEAAEEGEAGGKNVMQGSLFWLDEKKNIGLRLRVVEVGVPRDNTRIFTRREMWQGEAEAATCFKVSYEELVVRSGFLAGIVEGDNETEDVEGVEVLR